MMWTRAVEEDGWRRMSRSGERESVYITAFSAVWEVRRWRRAWWRGNTSAVKMAVGNMFNSLFYFVLHCLIHFTSFCASLSYSFYFILCFTVLFILFYSSMLFTPLFYYLSFTHSTPYIYFSCSLSLIRL